ncbi:MAG: zinc-ribbon domain-containing protein [Firmicutes bacterium]|nr:zinc-ribbon domain-containing protein [Bacillota bacterium]
MFCINCGKELPEGSRFCPFCGTRVPDVAAAAVNDAEGFAEVIEEEAKEFAEEAGELSAAAEDSAEELIEEAGEAAAGVSAAAAGAAGLVPGAAEKLGDAAADAAEKLDEEIAETYGELSGIAEEKAEELAGLSTESAEELAEAIEKETKEFSEEAGELSAAAEDRAEELMEAAAGASAAAGQDPAPESAPEAAPAPEASAPSSEPDGSILSGPAAALVAEEEEKKAKEEAARAKEEAKAAAAAAEAARKAAKPKSKKPLIIALVALLIAGAAGWYFYDNSAPVKLKKLNAEVDKIVAEGDYEKAIHTYKAALGSGLDDEAITEGIKGVNMRWLEELAVDGYDEPLELAQEIIKEFPDMTDMVLPVVSDIFGRAMTRAHEQLDTSAASMIFLKASVNFPKEVSQPLSEEYDVIKNEKAQSIIFGFLNEDFAALIDAKDLGNLRSYMENNKVYDRLTQARNYSSALLRVELPDGRKLGVHRDGEKTDFYLGEYDGNQRSGKGIQYCYLTDPSDKEKYYSSIFTSDFKNDLPSGEFWEKCLRQAEPRIVWIVTGKSADGLYEGPITVDYTSGDEHIVLKNSFSAGVPGGETLEDGRLMVIISEDGSRALYSSDPSRVYGLYPLHDRFL